MDPVHQDFGKWWFWDETWAYREGPFDTEEICRVALELYCDQMLGDGTESQKEG